MTFPLLRMRGRLRAQAGFTLIELMIVVAIIGILAAIATPSFLKQIRTSETGEPVQEMPRIANAIRAFVDARPQVDVDDLETAVNDANEVYDGCTGATCLDTVIPEVSTKSIWKYWVNVVINAEREVFVCARAEVLDPADAAAAAGGPYVLYSSEGAADAIWENHIYRADYVTQGAARLTAPAAGSCADSGPTAQEPA